MKNFKKGFTLIEVMVVISIISLLSTTVFSSLQSARDKAVIAAKTFRISEDIKAAQLYYSTHNKYPEPDIIIDNSCAYDNGDGTIGNMPCASACLGYSESENCWGSLNYYPGNTQLNNQVSEFVKGNISDNSGMMPGIIYRNFADQVQLIIIYDKISNCPTISGTNNFFKQNYSGSILCFYTIK